MSRRYNSCQGSGVRGQESVFPASRFLNAPPKTENRKPKTWNSLLIFLALTLLAGGCGKKLAPLAPDTVLPAPGRGFRLSQEGEALVLSWLLPRVNLLGQALTQVARCRPYRVDARGVSPGAS